MLFRRAKIAAISLALRLLGENHFRFEQQPVPGGATDFVLAGSRLGKALFFALCEANRMDPESYMLASMGLAPRNPWCRPRTSLAQGNTRQEAL